MKRQPSELANSRFDLAVIGGGIYGACIARDAALRGLRVALVEREDFGSGASSHSLKIIHGGFRYLQRMELRRLRESVHEQRYWLWAAPHNIRPLRCVVPAEARGLRGAGAMHAALRLYAMLAWDRNNGLLPDRRLPLGTLLSAEALREYIPGLDERLAAQGGLMWFDAQVQDTDQLLIGCIQDAVNAGAVVANYVEAERLLQRHDTVTGIRCRDKESDTTFELLARVTVNACGPYAMAFLRRQPGREASNGETPPRLARCTNLVTRHLKADTAFAIRMNGGGEHNASSPGRLAFVTPWRDCSVIGTANASYEGDPDICASDDDEAQELLSAVNAALPGANLTLNDVRYRHCGLMPAEGGRGSSVQLASQGQLIDHARNGGRQNLISVIGEKLTTARSMAQRTVDLVLHKLEMKPRPCLALETQLPGAHGFTTPAALEKRALQALDLRPTQPLRELLERYGTNYLAVLEMEYGDAVRGTAPGWELLYRHRCVYAIRHEMARRLEDVILRRTDLAIRGLFSPQLLQWTAGLMGGELGWGEPRKQLEIDHITRLFPALRGAPLQGSDSSWSSAREQR
ncbi:MAG: glycerol-3-phosphate dehydrogenase/oxidase [Rhodobacteraceae bacterium]|nr:glycerol-3-phosphate dehydrogenase/oxidase [Paracoccaceae bacterium]